MKPQLIKVPMSQNASFLFRQFNLTNVNSHWHYHTEIELIKIHNGTGTQFVGDNIVRFNAEDIVLIGSNLPHFWRYDEDSFTKTDVLRSTVIHFSENLWGERFKELPENILFKNLLERAKRGLLLRGNTKNIVSELMQKIGASDNTYRFIFLLECLVVIATGSESDVVPLALPGFQYQPSEIEHDRINTIYEYSIQNFKERIPLEVIASEIGLTPSSFCRYFKSKMGKSYTDFILELRVGHACKLVLENKLNIKQICYESGFNNFTSFHKHFKAITGFSPQNYQKSYIIGSSRAMV